MQHPNPKDPHKEKDPAPEPIDPPNDEPPVELPCGHINTANAIRV